ncbi:hypothetical protein GCM10023085_65600 [Actinomadura viridis]|uniref:Lipoprotein n=1 Tax=Actinomadura viridis TaxID=58110 RepID=A0A931DN61_9ACTN|nr:hypothetical protein [Actinomadura viridis]MBG6093025.1 hypothetical protein [Actinomadura viridis]
MRSRPAWSLLRLALSALAAVLAAGCLLQVGKSAGAIDGAMSSMSSMSSKDSSAAEAHQAGVPQGAPDRPSSPDDENGRGHCAKQGLSAQAAIAPAAEPAKAPLTLVAPVTADGTPAPGTGGPVPRSGPAPPPPDLRALCVLRI